MFCVLMVLDSNISIEIGALCWIEREVGSDPSSGGSFPRVFEEGTIY